QPLQTTKGEMQALVAAFQPRLDKATCPPRDHERSAEHGELPEHIQLVQVAPEVKQQAGYVAGIHRIGDQARRRQNSSMASFISAVRWGAGMRARGLGV